MKTLMFIERPENKGTFRVYYQLHDYNFYRVPEGLIRIARFESCFWPDNNMGYYGDTYMKQFIRKWKNKTKENIQRRKDVVNANKLLKMKEVVCFYIENKIIEYL